MHAAVIRTLLAVFLAGIYVLSIIYLVRRRRMSTAAYLFWGTFALLVPALGPFITIVAQPGRSVSGRPRRIRRRPPLRHQQ